MQCLVRPVRKADWRAVTDMEGAVVNPWDVADHREFLRPDRNCTYVATGEGVPLGFVCATVMPTHVLVERLVVAPAYRRCLVGRSLLDSLSHWFVTPKRDQMQCLVNEWAIDQQVFLRACGWRWAKTVRWGTEPDEYLFLKEFKG